MNIPLSATAAAGALLLLALGLAPAPGQGGEAVIRPAPAFPTSDPEAWINSDPLRMEELRGKAVLLEVWTFG